MLHRFETQRFTTINGLVPDHFIDNVFGRLFRDGKRQALGDFMVQLFAYQNGPSLESELAKLPTKEFESDQEYFWDVVGSARRNIALVEARDENGLVVDGTRMNDMIGAGTAPFELVFDEDYFADGEIIVGNLNEVYQFRILDKPRMEGTNVVYKVELAGGNTVGVPGERLQTNEKFSVEAAFVEGEMSRKVGDIHFAMPVEMRNEFSHVRLQHKVSGSKLDKKIAVGVPVLMGGKAKVIDSWMPYVLYQFEEQFRHYKGHALAYGRSNRNENGEYTNVGKSGYSLKMGAGLHEQMDVANRIPYNHFSLRLIEKALYMLYAGKVNFKSRRVVLRTGEFGALQFHNAISKEVNAWRPLNFNAEAVGAISKVQSDMHQTALAAGYQFTEWRAPNGCVLSVEVDPSYDDPVRNKIKHPNGGFASSYRYDILDMGTSDQPNIFKCTIKNRPERRGYQWGPFANPFTGETNNTSASYDEDSAVIHQMASLGICVKDPTRTMSIVPSMLLPNSNAA